MLREISPTGVMVAAAAMSGRAVLLVDVFADFLSACG
jgi:hypothetical protein